MIRGFSGGIYIIPSRTFHSLGYTSQYKRKTHAAFGIESIMFTFVTYSSWKRRMKACLWHLLHWDRNFLPTPLRRDDSHLYSWAPITMNIFYGPSVSNANCSGDVTIRKFPFPMFAQSHRPSLWRARCSKDNYDARVSLYFIRGGELLRVCVWRWICRILEKNSQGWKSVTRQKTCID